MTIRTIGSILLAFTLLFAISVSAFAGGVTISGDPTPSVSTPADASSADTPAETTDTSETPEQVAPTETAQTPVEQTEQPTEDPNGQHSGTETTSDSGTEAPVQPTQAPVSTAFAITKHPYGETIEEGTVTSFVSKATGAASATWIIQDANGNPGNSSHISVKEPYYDNGELVAKVVINNAPVNINGWSFRTEFVGNNGATARTDAAILKVYYSASIATPRPVQTPIPTVAPTPAPTLAPTPVPTATPEPMPAEPTPLPTYTPAPTVAPAENVNEVADGGASASLGRILMVIVITGAAAVIAVVGILAGSGILGGSRKKRRKRR